MSESPTDPPNDTSKDPATETGPPSRDELVSLYLDQIPFEPYPVQEEALLAWFSNEQGILVCAPTGTGKTLIAEAAMFEALHTRTVAYYTTPLIALTDQKFQELQEAAVRWGFSPDDVGLVTGNRCVNPQAIVRVVVAEILLNRLLHQEEFDFTNVSAVVMDEFHNFADRERGIVWELSLAMMPEHVRLMLLSATVGNAPEFTIWLQNSHNRRVQLIQSQDRKVPLSYHWVGDELLNEQIEHMSQGDDEARRTPALIFCFNREECWSVAEQLKGKHLIAAETKKRLLAEMEQHDWSKGVGPKLKQILQRGVGVHHAGMLPRYRRIVETLFQKKLLSFAVCTETLAAGINLPARAVVLTTLMKGPPEKKKVIDASTAHQIFGRAGRPQFDDRGFVFALAHEDDVKIGRWKVQYDQIPEDTKDPNLRKAKKRLKKKMPTRRKNQQYWNEAQFEKLIDAPSGKLSSRGTIPWRLLSYLLTVSPDVGKLRSVVRKRLLDEKKRLLELKRLTDMLKVLGTGGFVTLEPEPPKPKEEEPGNSESPTDDNDKQKKQPEAVGMLIGSLIQEARDRTDKNKKEGTGKGKKERSGNEKDAEPIYEPDRAIATPKLQTLLKFRSINPLYGAFLLEHLGAADFAERIQILESVLSLTPAVANALKVPRIEELPPGSLATSYLDNELIQRGLVTVEQLTPANNEDDDYPYREKWIPTIADKMRLLFQNEFPSVTDFSIRSVWAGAEILLNNMDFNKLVTSRNLVKQEGILFRHLLRLVLLCGEFQEVTPVGIDPDEWRNELATIADRLTAVCKEVDPQSTEKAIEAAENYADVASDAGAAKS